MKKDLIKRLEHLGFERFPLSEGGNGYFFTASIKDGELERIKASVSPNHFKPHWRRNLFFGRVFNGHWYCTSRVPGEYRGYRCRTKYTTDRGHIFVSAITLKQCVEAFIDLYSKGE